MNSRPDTCKCYQYSDFLCLNRYYGWYVFGGNQVEMGEYAMRKELDGWAAKGLNKPFVFTEYGADTYAGEHKLPSVMWSEEYQIEYLKMCHAVFDRYDFIKGELVWNFADFQTTEGILRVDGNKKGIFTRQRQPKRAAFYLKERWESLPSNFKCGNPSFTDNRVNWKRKDWRTIERLRINSIFCKFIDDMQIIFGWSVMIKIDKRTNMEGVPRTQVRLVESYRPGLGMRTKQLCKTVRKGFHASLETVKLGL